MIDFGVLPPEINSARMYAGPGPVSLSAAAAAWDTLAAELHFVASSYRSVITGLTTQRWMGPSSLSAASAFAPYMAWTAGAAARAAETAGQARLAAETYVTAFVMTVPPSAVGANRIRLATLVATNFFGLNSTAIAATEAEYGEMWAQDAEAMYQYAANSAAACTMTPFTAAPHVVNPSGLVSQTTAVGHATALSAVSHSSLENIVTSVPHTLQYLASPMSAGVAGSAGSAATGATTASTSTGSGLLSSSAASGLLSSIVSNAPDSLPVYFMAGATPLYGMSAVLGMAQTSQGLAKAASEGAMAAAGAAASGAAGAASAGAGTLGSLGSLGLGGLGSLGSAASLGTLAVPASWTSVIPAAHMSSAAALPTISLASANMPPSVMGSLPRLAAPGKNLGPRYGVIPTVMTRPLSGGYA